MRNFLTGVVAYVLIIGGICLLVLSIARHRRRRTKRTSFEIVLDVGLALSGAVLLASLRAPDLTVYATIALLIWVPWFVVSAYRLTREDTKTAVRPEDQLRAACTVHEYEAARVIDVYHWGKLNGVPDSEWFRERFTFTSDELLRYIRAAGIGQYLYDKAGDNRAFPNPYLVDRQGGYEVGWAAVDPFSHSARRFFADLDEAAADYVLAYWQLGRLEDAKTETDELKPRDWD